MQVFERARAVALLGMILSDDVLLLVVDVYLLVVVDFFRDKLVLRPSEISNSPEVIRRLGVISITVSYTHLMPRSTP